MEPDALWERYLDPRFRAFAPTFVRRAENAPNQPIIRIGDLEIGEMSKRPRTAAVGQDLHRRAFARHPHYAVAHARGYDPESHLAAMDIEGIDVAVLYGTDRKSTRLNSSHSQISYAVFCLKKKKKTNSRTITINMNVHTTITAID